MLKKVYSALLFTSMFVTSGSFCEDISLDLLQADPITVHRGGQAIVVLNRCNSCNMSWWLFTGKLQERMPKNLKHRASYEQHGLNCTQQVFVFDAREVGSASLVFHITGNKAASCTGNHPHRIKAVSINVIE